MLRNLALFWVGVVSKKVKNLISCLNKNNTSDGRKIKTNKRVSGGEWDKIQCNIKQSFCYKWCVKSRDIT